MVALTLNFTCGCYGSSNFKLYLWLLVAVLIRKVKSTKRVTVYKFSVVLVVPRFTVISRCVRGMCRSCIPTSTPAKYTSYTSTPVKYTFYTSTPVKYTFYTSTHVKYTFYTSTPVKYTFYTSTPVKYTFYTSTPVKCTFSYIRTSKIYIFKHPHL